MEMTRRITFMINRGALRILFQIICIDHPKIEMTNFMGTTSTQLQNKNDLFQIKDSMGPTHLHHGDRAQYNLKGTKTIYSESTNYLQKQKR